MKLLGTRIAVKVRILAPVSEGGIFLPPSAQKKQLEADVVYVGDEVENIKTGDHVIVDLYSGTEITVNGETLTILDEDNILAVVEDEDDGKDEKETTRS